MLWWIAAIFGALAALQAGAVVLQRRDHAFEKAAMGLQALATTAALMLAAYWYTFERKGQPQANTTLQVVGLKIAKDAVTLEARFSTQNLGATLLTVGYVDVRLQQMNPDSLPVSDVLKLGWQAFPDTVDGKDLYSGGVLMWPTVKNYRDDARRNIEPGETDVQTVDFVAPCTNRAMRIYYAERRPGSEQVWSDIAIVSLVKLCAQPVGSKEVLSDRSG